jgi:hypothetical protein
MRVIVIMSLLFLLAVRCSAQLDSISITNQKINSKIKELRAKKIDTILCYYIDCNGKPPRLMLTDTCLADDIKYLVWCDKGRFFMERFDECKIYDAVPFYQNPFYQLLNYYDKLQTEKILPRAYTERKGNKSIVISEVTDHTCFAMFEFYVGDKFLHKEIDLPDLDRLLDDKHINKNYTHNRNTIIASIRKEMEQMVYLYNKKGAQ